MISIKRKSRQGSASEDNHGKRIRHTTSAPAEGSNNNIINKESSLVSTVSAHSEPVKTGVQSVHDLRAKLAILNLSTVFTDAFTVEKHLGSGSFGHVYACRFKATGQQFAVKISQKTEDAYETEMVYNSGVEEARTLIGLDHPNILRLEHYVQDMYEKRIYIVTNLAAEGALFEQNGALSEFQVRHIFAQIFEGIKYLVSTPIQINYIILTLRSMTIMSSTVI